MGTVLPNAVAESESSIFLDRIGLKRIHQGKVRDTHQYPELGGTLLLVATDRVSIFDFVLPALVLRKGEVLTALTHFWLMNVLRDFPNHLRQMPRELISLLGPVAKRALLVQKTEIPPFEMIFRHHLGGSVYGEYTKTGMAGGQLLAPGLPKWAKLTSPIFTPSTKADIGHDVNIDATVYLGAMGERGVRAVEMFRSAYSRAYAYAARRDILVLDTKFEGIEMIADEVLTPDSSRFVHAQELADAMEEGREPAFYDKQYVRAWGMTVETPFGARGINKLNPTNAEHVKFVHQLKVPTEILLGAMLRYLDIFERLTGKTLDKYQREDMHIAA